MPYVTSHKKLTELAERGKGFKKGVTPFFDKDSFVAVAERELHKYRFAWLSFSCTPPRPDPHSHTPALLTMAPA